MKRITVLMSTYNGGKYLREQIDSILKQENVDVQLNIRDDGSGDATLAILKEYEKRDNVTVWTGTNLGPANSFMDCLYHTSDDSDYYAFSDQDDVWLPAKLEEAVKKIEQKEGSTILYCSNQTTADIDLNPIRLRYDFIPPTDLLNIIDKNYVAGCTMVFDRDLFRLLKKYHPQPELLTSRMHDTWAAITAACFGKIVYDERSFILYRQHENNVVGANEKKLADRLKTYLQSNRNNYHKKIAEDILETFGENVTGESRRILELYRNTGKPGGKLKLIASPEFQKGYFRNKMSFTVKLLLSE